MPEVPHAPGETEADRAWQRLATMAGKLFEACEDLDELGGVRKVARGWTPKATAKALATLRAARAALDAQVRELEKRSAGKYPRGPEA